MLSTAQGLSTAQRSPSVVERLLLLLPSRHLGDLVPQDRGLLVVLLADGPIHLLLEEDAAWDGKLPGKLVVPAMETKEPEK